MTTIVQSNRATLINAMALSLFVVNPILSVLITFHLILFEKPSKINYFVIFFLTALLLGFINSTKYLDSDLMIYYGQFLDIREYSFFDYIFSQGKEPFFYALSYLLYYLTNGSFKLYIVILSFISYYIFFISIYKFYDQYACDKKQILFAFALAALLPQLFSLSAHLLRQFLASSLIIYYIVNRIILRKNSWLVLIMAVFTHTTTALFIPFIFIPFFKKKIDLKRLILIVLPIIIVSFIDITKIAKIIVESPLIPLFISYGFNRAFIAETHTYLGKLPSIALILIGIMLCISLFYMYVKRISDQGLIHFLNVYVYIALFVLLNLNISEISMRFFFFIYFFFPFVAGFIFTRNAVEFKFTKYPIIILLLGGFTYNLVNGIWVYAPLQDILLSSAFSYFINP